MLATMSVLPAPMSSKRKVTRHFSRFLAGNFAHRSSVKSVTTQATHLMKLSLSTYLCQWVKMAHQPLKHRSNNSLP